MDGGAGLELLGDALREFGVGVPRIQLELIDIYIVICIYLYIYIYIYVYVSLICRRRLKSSPRTLACSKDLKISSQLDFF